MLVFLGSGFDSEFFAKNVGQLRRQIKLEQMSLLAQWDLSEGKNKMDHVGVKMASEFKLRQSPARSSNLVRVAVVPYARFAAQH